MRAAEARRCRVCCTLVVPIFDVSGLAGGEGERFLEELDEDEGHALVPTAVVEVVVTNRDWQLPKLLDLLVGSF